MAQASRKSTSEVYSACELSANFLVQAVNEWMAPFQLRILGVLDSTMARFKFPTCIGALLLNLEKVYDEDIKSDAR